MESQINFKNTVVDGENTSGLGRKNMNTVGGTIRGERHAIGKHKTTTYDGAGVLRVGISLFTRSRRRRRVVRRPVLRVSPRPGEKTVGLVAITDGSPVTTTRRPPRRRLSSTGPGVPAVRPGARRGDSSPHDVFYVCAVLTGAGTMAAGGGAVV